MEKLQKKTLHNLSEAEILLCISDPILSCPGLYWREPSKRERHEWCRYWRWQEAAAQGWCGLAPHTSPPHKHFLYLWSEEIIHLAYPFCLFYTFQLIQHKKNKREVGTESGLAMMLFKSDTQMSSN